MYDCADDILAYHDDEVTLPQSERTAMRDRRNANRDRVKDGLNDAGKPKPIEFKGQGSYAMKTMTQHPENNYDIDDGVYFEATDLVGPRGGEMSPLDARQMVRDAVDDGSFKTKPEVRTELRARFLRRRVPRRHSGVPAGRDEGCLGQET